MHMSKAVITPLNQQFKLTSKQTPQTSLERNYMARIPYTSGVRSLMYAMICSRPDLAYGVWSAGSWVILEGFIGRI